MENILNTELARLIDLLSALQDKKGFNAYLEKIKNHNILSYGRGKKEDNKQTFKRNQKRKRWKYNSSL